MQIEKVLHKICAQSGHKNNNSSNKRYFVSDIKYTSLTPADPVITTPPSGIALSDDDEEEDIDDERIPRVEIGAKA